MPVQGRKLRALDQRASLYKAESPDDTLETSIVIFSLYGVNLGQISMQPFLSSSRHSFLCPWDYLAARPLLCCAAIRMLCLSISRSWSSLDTIASLEPSKETPSERHVFLFLLLPGVPWCYEHIGSYLPSCDAWHIVRTRNIGLGARFPLCCLCFLCPPAAVLRFGQP